MVFLYGTEKFVNYRAALDTFGQQTLVSLSMEEAKACRGLLLPGGGDIHGKLDAQEEAVIRFFVENRRPILGICRGMQALNVYFGGTLHDAVPNHQSPDGDIAHPTHAIGLPASLLGAAPIVNSNHHQAVAILGNDLVACQWAPDGVVEAVTHRTLPLLGVQWHPERWRPGKAIFRWFTEELEK